MESKWHKVESSAIDAYQYDIPSQTLKLRFKGSGPEWSYTPVTPADFLLFKNAPSMGKFFHAHIKNNPGITAEKLTT